MKRMEAERIASLRTLLAASTGKLAAAFFETAFDSDPQALPAAIAEAKAVEIPAECTSQVEKNMVAGFRKLTDGIAAPAQTLRTFVRTVSKISENDAMAIRYGRGMAVLSEVRPGVLRCRTDSGVIDMKLDDPRARHTFFAALANYVASDPECSRLLPAKTKGVKNKQQLQKLRAQNIRWCEFHYRLMNRDFSPETAKLAPNDFWRRSFGELKKGVSALPPRQK